MKRKILVIEDNKSVIESVRAILDAHFFTIYGAFTGKQGLFKTKKLNPDLIVLDLNLPDMDGLNICQFLRSNKSTFSMPIIMLTARDSSKDIRKGLDSGADDYITKPFDVDEFEARVKAIFRRVDYTNEPQEIIESNGLKINTTEFNVEINGEEIDLTPKEFDLLSALVANKNKLLTHLFLYQKIWGYKEMPHYSFTLQSHISKLREKIGPVFGPKIKTIEAKGYKFEP